MHIHYMKFIYFIAAAPARLGPWPFRAAALVRIQDASLYVVRVMQRVLLGRLLLVVLRKSLDTVSDALR